jgi:hypothetical protein
MASQKQIDANRANAQKSTGPTSEAGKAKSRLNAMRDGLTGQVTTLSDEDRPVFEKLKAAHVADLAPATLTETKLAHAIAWDTWRLDHLRAIEMNVYSLAADEAANNLDDGDSSDADELDAALTDAHTFRSEAKRFELMSLYEQRMNRSMHRNLAILRDLQNERKRNYERDKKEEIQIARLCEFNDMPIRASARPSRNGFVFEDEEIAIGAVRQRYLDTAACVLKTTNPLRLYGNLSVGCGDSLLQKVADDRPISAEEYTAIYSVPLEARTMRRQTHPEEFNLRKS